MNRLALVVLFAAGAAHADGITQVRGGGSASFDPASVYKVPRGAAPALGPVDAPITIVAWSDYACGFCARAQETLDRLDRLYPGQIRWVHRELPLDEDHPIAAEAALAAGAQGKFRAMHERMYALRGRVDRADVELVARELGLDMLRFRAELDAGTYRKAIAADVADAMKLGVSGTPTFFVNGRPVHGNQNLQVFAQVVDEELVRAAKVRADKPADLYEALVAAGKLAADASSDVTNEPVRLDPREIYRVGLGLHGHQNGPDDAPVTIVEFSDFECPFCARQAPVLAKLRKKYGDDLRVVYRHYPVLFHPDSVIAAEAGAAAADQGKFWEFHDQVFGNFGKLSRADLEQYAKNAGLDVARFRAALDERRFHDSVIAEGASAEALGVDGTPTLFINGQPLIGLRDEEGLDRIVTAHLEHAKDALHRGLKRGEIYPTIMSMAKGEERADPAAIPEVTHVEMRGEERARAVVAACRRHDGKDAEKLAGALAGDAKHRAAAVCASEGIDLP
jgi:protein-disulfide isomerase